MYEAVADWFLRSIFHDAAKALRSITPLVLTPLLIIYWFESLAQQWVAVFIGYTMELYGISGSATGGGGQGAMIFVFFLLLVCFASQLSGRSWPW